MNRRVWGSRFLNDNGSVLGLNSNDLIGAVAVMVLGAELLRPIHLDLLAIPLALGALALLVPIRMRYRRGIIRDALTYFMGARLIATQKQKRDGLC